MRLHLDPGLLFTIGLYLLAGLTTLGMWIAARTAGNPPVEQQLVMWIEE